MIKDIEKILSEKQLDFMDLRIMESIKDGAVTLGEICDKVERVGKRQWLHHRLGLLESKGLLKQAPMKRGDTRRMKRSIMKEGKKILESLKNL